MYVSSQNAIKAKINLKEFKWKYVNLAHFRYNNYYYWTNKNLEQSELYINSSVLYIKKSTGCPTRNRSIHKRKKKRKKERKKKGGENDLLLIGLIKDEFSSLHLLSNLFSCWAM